MDSEVPFLEQNSKQEPEGSRSHNEKAEDNKSWYKKWRKKMRDMTLHNKLMVCFTGVIMVCTIVYALVSYFQWRALLDSNQINNESLLSVQRAFVTYSGMDLSTYPTSVQSNERAWVFTANLDNSGSYPSHQ